ncbi:MAG TPA: TetR-like C-terminal domain-containing protein [Hyphomicrobiaceae bacterium]|nr:TetR-like C-terminal domain-containing protein [Hyphomicrobiaceae bacterium]
MPENEDGGYRSRLKSRMVEIARGLLETEGLMAVQARRVTGMAECSVGTLYNVFNGLDGLIITVNTQTLKELGGALDAALAESRGQSIGERLMALAQSYLDFAEAHPKRWKAIFEHRFMSSKAAETMLGPYRADQNELFKLVEALLEGPMPNGMDRPNLARALFAAVHGIVMMALDEKLGNYNRDETLSRIRFIISAGVVALKR